MKSVHYSAWAVSFIVLVTVAVAPVSQAASLPPFAIYETGTRLERTSQSHGQSLSEFVAVGASSAAITVGLKSWIGFNSTFATYIAWPIAIIGTAQIISGKSNVIQQVELKPLSDPKRTEKLQACMQQQERVLNGLLAEAGDPLSASLAARGVGSYELMIIDVNRKLFSDFNLDKREFKVKRPKFLPGLFGRKGSEWIAHVGEEIVTRRAKSYRDFPAPATRIQDGPNTSGRVLFVQTYHQDGLCIVASRAEILGQAPEGAKVVAESK